MRNSTLILLLGAAGCLASTLALYLLLRAGYFADMHVTAWTYGQLLFVSVLCIWLAFTLPTRTPQ